MKVRIAIFTVVMLMLITLPVSKVPLMEGGRRMEKMMQISTSTQPPKVYPRPFLGFVYGGVHSVAQFRDVLAHDPALAAQFPGFDWSKARFETLKQSECAYIAYRRGDEFAWARKCRMIYAGELILTDGQFRIRAVCGNLISNTPMAPTIPMDTEPVAIALPDTPPTGTATTTPALADGPSVPPSLMPVTPVTPVGGPLLGTPSPIGLCCGIVSGPIVTVPDGDGGLWEALLALCVIGFAIYWRKND